LLSHSEPSLDAVAPRNNSGGKLRGDIQRFGHRYLQIRYYLQCAARFVNFLVRAHLHFFIRELLFSGQFLIVRALSDSTEPLSGTRRN
jgi:hypothetical protein